jgi:hypothetical protein
MAKITFVDLQGRFRVVTPSYGAQRLAGEQTEAEYLEGVWARLVARGIYSVPADHPHFYVEDADIQTKIAACSGSDFRYAGKPDADGVRDGTGGAWEMDTDGTPKVNMAKARGVHMDKIRVARDVELVKEDLTMLKALESGDTSTQATVNTRKQTLRDIPATFDITTGVTTPELLKAKWPSELPARE